MDWNIQQCLWLLVAGIFRYIVPNSICIVPEFLMRSFFAVQCTVNVSFQTGCGCALLTAKLTERHPGKCGLL